VVAKSDLGPGIIVSDLARNGVGGAMTRAVQAGGKPAVVRRPTGAFEREAKIGGVRWNRPEVGGVRRLRRWSSRLANKLVKLLVAICDQVVPADGLFGYNSAFAHPFWPE
jgi:hypothetical protein